MAPISSASVAIVILGIMNFAFMRVQAAPWPECAKHATHRKRLYGRGLELETYTPKSTYKIYKRDIAGPRHSIRADLSGPAWQLNESAISFTSSELGINSSSIEYRKGWSGEYGRFAYLRQLIDGTPVANGVANIVYNNNTEVVSFGSSFINTNGVIVPPSIPSLQWKDVVPGLEKTLGGKHTGAPPTTEYLAKQGGELALTYVMQVRNETNNLWVEAFVSAHSGELLSVTDFTAHATFNVVPIQKQNFFDGREILVDPEDLQASPDGWIAPPGEENGVTSGNNAIIFVDGASTNSGQPITISPEDRLGVFDDPYDPESPQDAQGLDATIANVFYVMNTMHDFSYRYGFQENQANFQIDNLGRGQAGGDSDPVQVSIRDTSSINNAQFSTPPDGIPPVGRFFFFNIDGVVRDSAFANDVLVHEFTHGITNRMTGGGTARCLQSLEAGGMGEGWSDMMAGWVAQTSETAGDFRIGTYFNGDGIRSRPYSTDESVNPLKFSDVGRLREVHAIGEVWANTLYNVYDDLVQQLGFNTDAFARPNGLEGNVVFMHNMIDGLLLQPCNPSILQARDAILAADTMRYNGANQCTMWNAFARKGMGIDATDDFQDGFSVPPECAN